MCRIFYLKKQNLKVASMNMIEKRSKHIPALIYRDTTKQINIFVLENKSVACRRKRTAIEAVENLFENVQNYINHPEIGNTNKSFISTAYFAPKLMPIKYTESIICSNFSTRKIFASSIYCKRKYVTFAKISAEQESDPDSEITWETTKKVYVLGCEQNPQIKISDYDNIGNDEKTFAV